MKFRRSISKYLLGWVLGTLLILGGTAAGKAYAAEYLYYTQSYDPFQMMVAPLSDPTDGKVIYTSETGSPYAVAVDEANRVIYFSDPHSTVATIFKAGLDGSGVTPFITGVHAQGLAVNPANGDLYYAEPNTGTVYKAAAGEAGGTIVYSSTGAPRAVAVDAEAGYLYIADYNLGAIIRSGLDGSNPGTFIDGVHAAGVAVDAAHGKLYYSVAYEPDFYVAKADLTTGLGEEIIYTSATGSPRALAVHKEQVFFSDWHSTVAGIFKAGLTGDPEPSVVLTGVNAYGLAVASDTPRIMAVSPSEGPSEGGTSVTLTGTGFAGATGVSFGGNPGKDVTVVSNTVITVISPPGIGTVDVRVEAPGGTSATGPDTQFTYTQPVAAAPTASVTTNGGFIKRDAAITLFSESGSTLYYTVAVNAEPDTPTLATSAAVAHGGTILYPVLSYGDVLNIKAVAAAPGKTESEVAAFRYNVQPINVLSLSNVTVGDKQYDGNADAAADFSGAVLSGIIGSDEVALAGTARAVFSNKDVGIGKPVALSGASLTGADAEYYSLSPALNASSTIIPKLLILGEISIADKEYDGTPAGRIERISIAEGIVSGDSVSVDISQAAAVFTGGSAAGTDLNVAVSNITLTGVDEKNYSIVPSATATADISPKPVTISHVTVADKMYDGTRLATLTGASLTGRIGADDVAVDMTEAAAAFDNEDIGSGKSVTVTGLKLKGTSSGNYRLDDGTFRTSGNVVELGSIPTPVASIAGGAEVKSGTAITLTAEGLPGAAIYYAIGPVPVDAAAMTSHAASGEAVTVSGSPGDAVVLSVYGAKAGYISSPVGHYSYTIRQKRVLTVEGARASNKDYDGTRSAAVSGGTLSGQVEPGDDVILMADGVQGQFADKQAGGNKPVAVSGYALAGADTGYYELAQPSLTADIRAKEVTAINATIEDKVYDGGVDAVVTGLSIDGKVPGDDVDVHLGSARAVFADAAVGSGKAVTITGLALTGSDAGNYRLASDEASAQGVILPAGTVAPPKASPDTRNILSGTLITLSAATTDSEIFYTVDGSPPDRSSRKYTGPIPVTGDSGDFVTVKAFAVKTGMVDSEVMEQRYMIAPAGMLMVTLEPGDRMINLSWPVVPQAVTYSVYGGAGDTYLGAGSSVAESVYGYQAAGLQNGVSYSFYVTAVDEAARILQSARVSAVPRTVPGMPSEVTAVAGNASVTITFTAPADNGGSPIESYTAVASPGGKTAESTGSPIVFTGLTNGVSYRFVVKAHNAAGTGLESAATSSVVPMAPDEGDGGSSDSGGNDDGAGNETGGSSGVGSGSAPASDRLTIDVQEETITAILSIRAATDVSGRAVATLTLDDLQDAVDRLVEEAGRLPVNGSAKTTSLLIRVAGSGEETNQVELHIAKSSIEWAASSRLAGLTISTPLLTESIDSAALMKIAQETTGVVRFLQVKKAPSGLTPEAQRVVGDRPLFELGAIGEDKSVTRLGSRVTVSVPYAPKAGEDTDAILIYRLSGAGSPVAVGESLYDPKTGQAVFRTDFFSQYGVGYNPVRFQDVAKDAWYGKAVGFLAAREITTGTGEGTFSPDTALTRGSFLTMVMRAYGITPADPSADNFADAGSTYYTGYLAAAKLLGIAEGVGSNRFAPESNITRQEMITLLRNILIVLHEWPDGSAASAEVLSGFTDAGKVEPWAEEAMVQMVQIGWISGSDGLLRPTGTATRAEMAQLLFNLLTR